MVLPVVKLGTLALKTFCKPIGNRIKKEAGFHPRFRQFIINVAQVAGVAVIFEVQRSSRSEARKEEVRKQELEAMKQRDEELSREIEFLKNRITELEQHSRTRGVSSIFSIKHPESSKDIVRAG